MDTVHPPTWVLLDLDGERLGTRIKLLRLGSEETGQMLAALFGEEI